MILIADSGSTKTDWRILVDGNIQQFKTKGLNPYYVNTEEFTQTLQKSSIHTHRDQIEQVYFYGAGCGAISQQALVKEAIVGALPKAKVEVFGDLIGAARATCGLSDGIVCILGTGSNSCLYQDQQIKLNSPSNGIWLGDEGSAGYLGKVLITDYLNDELPAHIKAKFEKRFSDRRDQILHHVYKEAAPNTYLASFSRFIYHNLADPYFVHIVYQAFEDFFTKTVMKYPDYEQYPIHFVGSVAFYYVNVLRTVATDLGIGIQHVLEKPIAGLALYHQEMLNADN